MYSFQPPLAADSEVLARERRTNKVYSNFYPGTSNYFYTQRTSGHNPFQAHLPVSCGHPGQPRNGRTRYSRTTPGSIALHTCNPGYKLEGAKLRLCQSNGRWTPQLPSCTRECSCFLRNRVRMLPLSQCTIVCTIRCPNCVLLDFSALART